MSEFSLIIREIPYSGKAYIRCDRYDAADFPETLEKQLKRLWELGAKRLYCGVRDAGFAEIETFSCAGHMFRFYSDFHVLQKTLTPEAGPALRLKRMTADNAQLFAALYNEAFSDVPNAMTMDGAEQARIQTEPFEAGFFMLGGEPLGVYILDFSEPIPEIAAICVCPAYRGSGNGHTAMRTLERRLLSLGYAEAQLLAASANEAACALYKACGYYTVRTISRWFALKEEA